MSQREHFVFVEKYRPQTLEDCILSKDVEEMLTGIVHQQETTNLLLVGKAGTGKTTVAKALVRTLGADSIVINASDENGIDVIRGKVKDFCSTLSLDGRRKYVILDEADHLSAATQPALRGFMEEYSRSAGFILTANFPSRIIAPLQSRCSLVDFKIPAAERVDLAVRFTNRACQILTDEGVTFDKRVVGNVVMMYFPDFRRVLNELQRFSATGTLSEAILSQLSDKDIVELFGLLKKQEFTNLRKWTAAHADLLEDTFYTMMYEQIVKYIKPSKLPEMIVVLADYAYRSGFAADKTLNALACLVEIMSNGEFV